jgi:hypothetical protein
MLALMRLSADAIHIVCPFASAPSQVFPAVPHVWDDGAVFYRLRAMRAFLVSAELVKGSLQWLQVESISGAQPVVVAAPFASGHSVDDLTIDTLPAGAKITLSSERQPGDSKDGPLVFQIHGLEAGVCVLLSLSL